MSILAAEKRRDAPRVVPRPYADSTVPQGNGSQGRQQPKEMNGHRKMLAAAARRGMVRHSG